MSEIAASIFRRNLGPLKPIDTEIESSLSKLPQIEAVVFDIYGTLFVSGSGDIGTAAADPKVDSLEQAIAETGIQLDEAAEAVLKRHYESIQESHRISKAKGIPYPEVDILEIWRETMKDYSLDDRQLETLAIEFESRANPVWPMPGLQEVLAALSLKRPLGIVSNAQFFTLELFEVFLGLSRQQLGFISELEVYSFAEGQAKPGIEIYEVAVDRLGKHGIHPANVLYVGNDMLNDIQPAQTVGFRTALFAGDKRSLRLRKDDERVDGIQPDITVKSLSQIIQCVE